MHTLNTVQYEAERTSEQEEDGGGWEGVGGRSRVNIIPSRARSIALPPPSRSLVLSDDK